MFDQPVQNYIIGGIILVLVIMGGVTLISLTMIDERTGEANVDLSAEDNLKFQAFNQSANKINEMNSAVDTFYGNIAGKNADPGLFGWLDSIISLIWTPFNTILTTFKVIPNIFTAIATTFLPESLLWIPATLIGIITVVIIFAIIALVFRIKV